MIDTRILRSESLSDYDIIRLNALLRELNPNLERYTRKGIEALTASGENIIYVACQYGLIIGMVILLRDRECEGRYLGKIQKFIVHGKYQGQDVGKMLLSRVIGIARQSGVEELSLVARDHRSAARALYESPDIGFKNCGMLTEGLWNYKLRLR